MSVVGLLLVMLVLGPLVPSLSNPLVLIATALVAIGLVLNHQAG